MGLAPETFERLTPAEFIYAWLGWAKRERERWAVWVATCIQLDRKDRHPMTEMFPLPWEGPTAPAKQEPTMQERMERIEEMKRCIRK